MQSLSGHLEIEPEGNPVSFSADVTGITFLKAQFLTTAKDFFYLRKGEDVNAHLIAAIYGISLGFDWNTIKDSRTKEDALDLVKAAQENVENGWFSKLDLERQDRIRDYKIICIKEHDTLRGKSINEYLGVKVFFIPREYKHLHRLYLNDTSFATFYRHGKDDEAKFYGYIGQEDHPMIERWKEAFLQEWKLWQQWKKRG
jgi:hypothetical protein